jgi:PAS domain-containing protein
MLKHFMKIAGLVLMFCYSAAYFVLLKESSVIGRYAWIAWLGPLGFACALYLAARTVTFYVKYTRFSKRLLEGNYQSGIQAHRFSRDEGRALADLTNKVADRLRMYDTLRAERVAINVRAREIMHERTDAAVVIADIEEGVFLLNPASRAIFGLEQESMSIESIVKRPENDQFARLYFAAVERDKVPHTSQFTITLPARNITREIDADIVPIKDREEKVRFVLIFLNRTESPAKSGRDTAAS